ncbi:HtaA domain-containing protein [Microbacterium sp. 18062]|uniref:HtaA domain-containing protein n=1 Tax=Microbacterium sp. 18062 TaxID=2681410 RepID=UPI00135A6358|nr:HtaA domain-containing protein [Microbacterium sp. 18062]
MPSRSIFPRATALLVSLFVLLSSVLVANPAAAEDEVPAVYAISEGAMDWGVRESYRTYVVGNASGRITLSEGLTENEDGTYRWPVAEGTFDPVSGALDVSFEGKANFWGHEGLMDLTIWDLRIVADAYGDAVLYADYRVDDGTTVREGDGVEFAEISAALGGTVTPEEGRLTWDDVYASLGRGGVEPFLDHYSYGNPVDAIDLDLAGDWPSGTVPETWAEAGIVSASIDDLALPATASGWVTGRTLSDPARGVVFAVAASNVLHVFDAATREVLSTVENVSFLIDVNEETGELLVKAPNPSTQFTLVEPDGAGRYRAGRTFAGPISVGTGAIDDVTGAIVIGGNSRKTVFLPGADDEYAQVSDYTTSRSGIPVFFDAQGRLVAQQGAAYLRYDIDDSGSLVLVDQVTPSGTVANFVPDRANDRLFTIGGGVLQVYENLSTSSGTLMPAASVSAIDGLVGTVVRYDPARQTLVTTGGATLQARSLGDAAGIGETVISTAWDTTGAGIYAGNEAMGDAGIWFFYASATKVVSYGTTPAFTASPSDQTAVIPAGADSTDVTLTSAVDGEGVTLHWQQKIPGAIAFADVEGAVGPELTITASSASSGTQYRVIAANDFGRVVSDTATLTVQVAPSVSTQPQSVSVVDGGVAEFTATGAGNPAPSQDWEIDTGSGWQSIEYSDTVSVFGDTLTVEAVEASLDGAQYRAVFTSAAGTAYSDPATLTVTDRPDAPAETTTYTGVAFEWTGSAEWQAQPPNGSAAHYLSAGVSDGTEATYSAKKDGAEILQRTSSGSDTATYATRGAHVNVDGAAQVVRLDDGTATVEPDGSAVIEWPASFSVNFYDGLVPSTMSNLVLTVDENGSGTLTADLSGYQGDIANPNAPKEAVTPAADVTVATFANVTVDTENGFTVRPDYRNVTITAPEGEASQNTTVSGWGAWPQEFVTFHGATGLAAYFYSTGGSLDSKKAPNAFAVGFDGATPEVPAEPEEPGTTPEPSPNPTTPALTPTTDPESGVVEGSLVWGVKQSFRSYITGSTAKGTISVSNGASVLGGSYWFGQSSTDWTTEAGTGTTGYQGAVRFTGHSGILDLTFANPQVRIDSASSGALIVTANGSAVEVGSIDLGAAGRTEVDGGVSYSNAPVTLTSAGARVFSYGSSQFYAAGAAMDPVSFVVGASATSTPGGGTAQTVAAHEETSWTPPAEPPANTGLYIDPEVLKNIRPGTEITVIGEGYEPSETDIKVVLYSDPVVLEENLTADASGRAQWSGIVPLDTEIGAHTLTFQSESQDLGIEVEVLEPEELVGCTVTAASLDWGFKESFRSYISGSIAHGEWTVSDGATYETPEFGWSDGEGVFDAEIFTGQVSFEGTIRFTGHDGLLDTTVANPTILFTGPDTAYLLLDVAGVTMEDALAGNADNALTFDQVSFVKLDLSAGDVEISEDGSEVTASAVPAVITSQGYEAFPNYEAGTEFDPVSFSITTETDCVVAVPEDEDTADVTAAVEAPDADDTDLTWLAWTGGGIALAGLITALAIWIARRRRAAAEGAEVAAVPDTGPFDDVLGGGR